MKTAIFLADYHEEVEALSVVDLLRRAGITCDMISITGNREITSSHNVHVIADMLFEEADLDSYDAYILPGGMPGTENLFNYKPLTDLLMANANKKLLCAICAAPTVFGRLGLLKDKVACCYPAMENNLFAKETSYEQVVQDGLFITSRGLGTAIPFGLKIIEALDSESKANEIATKIVFK